MIGLDTESIPTTVPRKGGADQSGQAIPQPVALLQVASERHAFLFDLPALSVDPEARAAADELLVRLFGEQGCEIRPQLHCFLVSIPYYSIQTVS